MTLKQNKLIKLTNQTALDQINQTQSASVSSQIDYWKASIFYSYQNKITYLIKKKFKTKHQLIQKYIDQKLIYKPDFNDFKYCLNADLSHNTCQDMIRELVNDQFIIFRELTSSIEYFSTNDQEKWIQMKNQFSHKDRYFPLIIEDFERLIPKFFNWNIINDFCEIEIFKAKTFDQALILTISNLIFDHLAEFIPKISIIIRHQEIADHTPFAINHERILLLWKKCLNLWHAIILKYLAPTEIFEQEFYKLLNLSSKIAAYRSTLNPYTQNEIIRDSPRAKKQLIKITHNQPKRKRWLIAKLLKK
ncbi:hypothetical protein MCAV_06300 [[Mycoplasma] cavipharyngis]|uniref:hypothetical protein n=1 Tax=[Mycoplasma] cavipharyngis TaxID=92757 RepID=UPI0037039949